MHFALIYIVCLHVLCMAYKTLKLKSGDGVVVVRALALECKKFTGRIRLKQDKADAPCAL